MNKKIFTLLTVFLSLSSFSFAQLGEKYVFLVSEDRDTITWTRENQDRVVFHTVGTGTKAALDSALWKPMFVKEVDGKSVFQFVNKATNRLLSFSTDKNKEGKYTTAISAGISSFIYMGNETKEAPIYASCHNSLFTFGKGDQNGEMIMTENLGSEGKNFKVEAAPDWEITTKKELTGTLNTFKLIIKGKEDNEIFTQDELIPTPVEDGKFKLQLLGQQKSKKGTHQPLYITIDTVSAIEGTDKAAGFKLDTLVAKGTNAYQGLGNGGLQTFRFSMNMGNDSIVIKADTMVRFNEKNEYEIISKKELEKDIYIGYKIFGNDSILVVDCDHIQLPFISLYKGSPVTLPEGTGVYSLKVVSEDKTKDGKYLIGGGDYIDKVSEMDPYTQVYVKENEDGTYSMQAREGKQVVGNDCSGEELFNGSLPLYEVDKKNGLYRWEGCGDTLQFSKMHVNMYDKHIGYKHFTKEYMASRSIILSTMTDLTGDIYLGLNGSDLVVTRDLDEAYNFRLYECGDLETDTIYYGARDLGDELYCVAYALADPYQLEKGYLNYGEDGKIKLVPSKDQTPKRFFFRENIDGGTFKIVSASDLNGDKMMTIDFSSSSVFYTHSINKETYFSIEPQWALTYENFPTGVYTISNDNQMLTSYKGAARFMRPGDNVRSVVGAEDLKLYIDSAYIDRNGENTEYGYYIYKEYNKDINGKVTGTLLSASGDFKSGITSGDSAIFRPVEVIADTVYYMDELDKKGLPKKVKVKDNTSVVSFKLVEGGHQIVLMNDLKMKLAKINDVLIFTDKIDGLTVNVECNQATDKEKEPEISTVRVISGKRQISLIGAEGKNVQIYNVLGQLLVNRVMSSDEESLTVPSGVVIIAIEGEKTLKTVVR